MSDERSKVKEGIRILKCTCEHEFQDQLYGPHMRVHNVTKEGNAACVVCCPNLKTNKMNPATDTSASAMLGHSFIAGKKDRGRFIKKVSQ